MGPALSSYRGEFQPHASSNLDMTHNRRCSELPFFDHKIDLCIGSHARRLGCLNKGSAEAEIAHTQNITARTAGPKHANFWRFDS